MLDESEFIDRALDLGRGVLRPGRFDRERRVLKRRSYHGWVVFLAESSFGLAAATMSMRCLDLSSGGLSATCGQALAPDAAGTVLMSRSDGAYVLLNVSVSYCRCRGQMDFVCGLRFNGEATDVTLDDFKTVTGEIPEVGEIRRAG